MHRSSGHNATLIIILGIITTIIQFGIYYFFKLPLLAIVTAVLLVLLCSYFILENSLNFDSCFSYSLFNIFLCFIVILFTYYSNNTFFRYEPFLLLFVICNWFVPTLYCMLRVLFDTNYKYKHFNTFYRNISIIFMLIYTGILIFILFIHNDTFIFYNTNSETINFIPFYTLASLINDYIGGNIDLFTIFKYVSFNILLFIPYGFYAALVFRGFTRIIQFITLSLLPVIIEIVQYVLLIGNVNMDDIILGFIGGFLGSLCYSILNRIFHKYTDEDFLYERTNYSFYNNSIYY